MLAATNRIRKFDFIWHSEDYAVSNRRFRTRCFEQVVSTDADDVSGADN